MKKLLFKSSVFFKLIIVVIVFGVLMNIALFTVLRFSSDFEPRKVVPKLMHRMQNYIESDIGEPPDTVKARQVGDETGIFIRYESENIHWSYSNDIPTLHDLLDEEEFRVRFERPRPFPYNYKGKILSIRRTPKGTFILLIAGPKDKFVPERAILVVVILATIFILLLYFTIKRLIKPIKQLSATVASIGEGNYEINLPVQRNDEFGELAKSINDMSGKIKSQMKSKEQLLIDVSHELRTPLTRIKLGLEVGSSKEKINEDVQEMEKMVTGLLEAYKTDSNIELKMTNLNLFKLLEEIINESLSGDRLKMIFDKDSVLMKADEAKLKTVFRNLIDNALKYSNYNVTVTVVDLIDSVKLIFEDKGQGISKEDLKFVFEPFYRADRSRSKETGGFGLGLSICKKIIDTHNGLIEIESYPGEGTKVLVTLPKNDLLSV